ncbi:MAG TPA: Npt1/Npt2 family nucleotide transporter [Candidatus Binatia bacterium]|nr:Npt1/Npt2 family nucleotide transporter [Candidatus Binatia bacterium]
MNHFSLPNTFSRFFDIRPGEARRVGMMVSLLFFLLAANNVIKVVRDSLFLSRFPITHLPYVYLLAALLAGVIIAVYTRYTVSLPLYRLMLGSNAFIISNVIMFWFLIVFFNFAWGIYAFYIWSAIVSILAVAQFWTFAGLIFTSREAKRLFGIFNAGGSLGGILGGFGSGWAVNLFMGTNELFWLIGALFAGAFGVVWLAGNELSELQTAAVKEIPASKETKAIQQQTSALGSILASRYLQLIAGAIFVSVAVSTLIDFQFKAAAKTAYPSQDELTAFFGSYYAWVAIITFFSQVVLTRRLLTAFGLIPSLFLLPAGLFAGSLGILVWPGLFSAMATRLTDAVLRASVNQSGMEILYLPLSATVKRRVKTFLDVVLQRLGDGAAGLVVLFYTLFMMQSDPASLGYFSLGLIILWAIFILVLRSGYLEALRAGLETQAITWEGGDIDYADKQTIEAVLQNLQKKDERALLFGLDLAENLDPEVIVPRLPLSLLQHPSALVRGRSLKLFATSTEPEKLKEIVRLLQDENREVQAEAINVVCAIRKEEAIPLMRPYLESPDPRVQRSAIECLLHHGDAEIREVALATFRKMIADPGTDGAAGRIEAARLMGEVDDPEFPGYLSKLIREDPSIPVMREALAAAGKRKEPTLLRDIIMRLCCPKTKSWARQALIEYGEVAVETLREALLDSNISRDIRLSIPRTLSKIGSPSAMDALLSGLNQEDGSLRYKIILGLEEMARRLPNLPIDQHVIEMAIVSEARRYYRRFLTFFALFGDDNDRSMNNGWLLHQALLENMEREKERVLRLLSLIYRPEDIGSATTALRSGSRAKQAQAIEFLDNLLIGDVKRHVFPLFDDAPAADRFQEFLALLGLRSFDRETALQELLKQDDVWVKAATFWEIGLRGLRDFRGELQQYLNSKDPVLKETAALVMSRI